MYERIKQLCKERGISVNKLEQELKIAKGSLCKMATSKPSVSKVQKISDYFGVSIDYLMTGKEKDKPTVDSDGLNSRDRHDIAKDMERIREKLKNKEDGPVSFDGNDINDDDAELVLDSIEVMLKRLKKINKEKYNPNKNKK